MAKCLKWTVAFPLSLLKVSLTTVYLWAINWNKIEYYCNLFDNFFLKSKILQKTDGHEKIEFAMKKKSHNYTTYRRGSRYISSLSQYLNRNNKLTRHVSSYSISLSNRDCFSHTCNQWLARFPRLLQPWLRSEAG